MKTDSRTETGLVEHAADDLDAFGELVEHYRNSIHRQCFGRVRDWQHAEDLAQETFVRAYLKLGQLSDPELFPNWLRRIASNVCSEFLRSPARKESATDTLAETAGPAIPSGARNLLPGGLDALPDETRACVELFYNSALSYRQIAEALHTSIASVKGRLRRAKAVLRKELAELEPQRRSAFTQRVLDTLEQLECEDPGKRKRAAVKLRSALATDRVESVLAGLADPSPLERSYSIGGSRKHPSPRVRDALVGILLHDEWEENRLKAANALISQGDPSVVPHLEQAMADPWNPRDVAAAAKSAIRQLQALQPPTNTELEKLGFRQELAAAAMDPRSRAEMLSRLRTALGDPDSGVRNQALKTLQELGDRRAVPAIARLLDDPADGIRAAAALALGEIGGKRAMEALAETFEASYARKRPAVAFRSLIRVGDRSVLPHILSALGAGTVFDGMRFAARVATLDDLPAVRQAVRQFSEGECPPPWNMPLTMLSDGRRGPELIEYMAKWPLCVEIAADLARIGDTNARQVLRELLLTRGSQQAGEALAERGEFGFDALREALRHADTDVRMSACSALSIGEDYTNPAGPLSTLAHPAAVRALATELADLAKRDPKGSIRLRAKVALRHLQQA